MNTKIKFPLTRQEGATVTFVALCIVWTLFLAAGCKKNEEASILLTISADPTYSVQLGEKPDEFDVSCYMVVSEESSKEGQQLELNAIEKFTYEKGCEYLLKVKKVANNDLFHYSLIETVSKTKITDEIIVLLNVTTEWIENGSGQLYERVVVEEEGSEWWLPSSFKIEGFEYENGFDYLLKVHKTIIQMPPQSGFLTFNLYSLIEVISKTPKTS